MITWLKSIFEKRVSCRRCGRKLRRKSEKDMGISWACLKAEQMHKEQQIAETKELENNKEGM